MVIIGIESSCDETAVAIIKDSKIIVNSVYSQDIHRKYGGVVPEIASREHEVQIVSVIEDAMKKSKIKIEEIDGIAVTYGPGLMGALLVGLNFAKGLALSLNIPFIGVNHLEGHLFASMIDNSEIQYPFINLLVSGGHTQIWQVDNFGDYKLLGATADDAAGEAFDKGARMLGLNYPGGPEIQNASIGGDYNRYKFPRPLNKNSKLDFSFSGLKTSLLYTCQRMSKEEVNINLKHLCASYQEAIVDTLLLRIKYAIEETGINSISISGGVAANKRFREKILNNFGNTSQIFFPPMEYCTDNAAMIGLTGEVLFNQGKRSDFNLKPIPNLSLV
tara:strand:- start:264 stop:1259 length:996 start_codon:yes stop_codon:yes gene_type:complete